MKASRTYERVDQSITHPTAQTSTEIAPTVAVTAIAPHRSPALSLLRTNNATPTTSTPTEILLAQSRALGLGAGGGIPGVAEFMPRTTPIWLAALIIGTSLVDRRSETTGK